MGPRLTVNLVSKISDRFAFNRHGLKASYLVESLFAEGVRTGTASRDR